MNVLKLGLSLIFIGRCDLEPVRVQPTVQIYDPDKSLTDIGTGTIFLISDMDSCIVIETNVSAI